MFSASSLHLVRRTTYGPTPALLTEIGSLGAAKWLDRQLAPQTIDDSACDKLLARYPALDWSIPTTRAKLNNSGGWDAMFQVVRATLTRALWSKRQLFEVMVEFWSNHLNVTCPSSDVWDNRADYDRVIREHALGSFDDLLVEASLHPAMQRYLDNASSNKWHPNENQGRELLELHTVGVGAGYGEDDVKNSARILTGVTVGNDGTALYKPAWHWTGPVQVLGFTHQNADAAGGLDVAKAYLRYLARHESTAAQLARKLAVRFVSDDPSPGLVERLAQTYLDHDTAIVPVLRELFSSSEFKAAAGQKVRRPYEDVVATVRVLGLKADKAGTQGVEALHWMLAGMGHAPLAWAPPNGYPDVAAAWSSPAGSLARWNAHLNIGARWWPGKNMLNGAGAMSLMPAKLPATHGAFVDGLALRLLNRRATAGEKAAVCAFLTDQWNKVTPGTRVTRKSAIVTWRLPYVVALLLDTPEHALR
ncbi:DUF1800 domain-containing protein [Spongisporangium articulatum]|uniref:DUF1800 domain-containing protein n=1 Tax=Spongisporangium articulatum TaxID=3362603 RepID=A0ABW8AIB0_9ACTN